MRSLFSFVAVAAVLIAAPPAGAADKQAGLRPELGKPLQAARDLIAQQKFGDALVQIRKAEAAAPLSAEETGVLEQLRGIAAEGTGDTATAAHAFEAAVASGKLPPADRLRLTGTLAGVYYQIKDYPKAIIWAERYHDAGGSDEAIRTLLAQAYYLNQDWAGAYRVLTGQIAAAEKSGARPAEGQLQLLADTQLKQNDTARYLAALEKLVAAYPKAEYWHALIQHVQAQPGFPRRLALDVSRLSLAVGALSSAPDYTRTAELALEAGLPGEAKALLDQGFAARALGEGPEAARQERLRALAAQQAAADLSGLEQRTAAAAAAPDGGALVNAGVDYLGYGQPERAARLIEQGLAKGVTKHPDDAKLHLGVAYLAAGQRDKSVQAFRSIQGSDTAELAKLWAIYSEVRSS
jgi:hypothetical protein